MKILSKNFDIFNNVVQNIDCGYTLEPPEAVLTSTHNLCFGSKIRKTGCHYVKKGFKGVSITRTVKTRLLKVVYIEQNSVRFLKLFNFDHIFI